MSTATRPGQPGPGFTIYVTLTVLVLLFGIVSIFSIGMFILPVGLVMAIGIGLWSSPWIVAALVSAAATFSFVYYGTTPLICGDSYVKVSGHPAVHRARCTRWLLPDIEGRSTTRPSDSALAFGIAAGSAPIAGLTAAVITRKLTRRETGAA